MSEPKPSEQYHVSTDEVREAMEMLGAGYDRPSIVISPPHAVMERRGNEFKEVITPAFVKISTDFKEELAKVDEISLKVWLYIALSVNRYSGKANPSLRTIAEGTGLAVNTIQAALKRLETDYNLLTVDRESRKYNIYEPLMFVSANRKDPVSSNDTIEKSVSVQPESVSVEGESVSPRLILNQSNQINQKEPRQKIQLPQGSGVDWLIRGGVESSKIAQLNEKEQRERGVADFWEKIMGYNPLPWWSDKDLKALLVFLLGKTSEEMEDFAKWSKRPFSAFSPEKARAYPRRVIELWPQAFAAKEAEPSYYKRPAVLDEDESQYVIPD